MPDEELYGEDQCCDMCPECINCDGGWLVETRAAKIAELTRENEELIEMMAEVLNKAVDRTPLLMSAAYWLLARHPEAKVRL